MTVRRDVNSNGEKITKFNIELTPTEEKIISYAKKKYGLSKTNFAKRAFKFWYEVELKKDNNN